MCDFLKILSLISEPEFLSGGGTYGLNMKVRTEYVRKTNYPDINFDKTFDAFRQNGL